MIWINIIFFMINSQRKKDAIKINELNENC